jgi:hypothetical protein
MNFCLIIIQLTNSNRKILNFQYNCTALMFNYVKKHGSEFTKGELNGKVYRKLSDHLFFYLVIS